MGVTKNSPPYFRNYPEDDLNDAKKLIWSNEQFGMFKKLQDWQWKADDGFLPDDPIIILACVGLKPESTEDILNINSCLEASAKHVLGTCWTVLQSSFKTSENFPGKIYDPKLREQWLCCQNVIKKKIEAGKKGGESKASGRKSKRQADAKRLPGTSQADAKQMPIYSDSDSDSKRKIKSLPSVDGKDPSLRSVEEEERAAVPGCEGPEKSGQTKGHKSADLPDYAFPAFEAVWDLWPRKEGYGAAKRAWNKLRLPKETVDQILVDIPNWKNYTWKQYTSVTFIKKLENWLLEEGYRDRPPRRIIC